MSDEIIGLSFSRNEVHEVGAALVTWLVCPEATDKDDARRGGLYDSLCAKALWERYLANPDDVAPVTVKPQHVFRDLRQIDSDVNFIRKRFGERMVAGRMAMPFLIKATSGFSLFPDGVARWSANECARWVREDAGMADAANVKSRIWAPSARVIHLAAALAYFGQPESARAAPYRFEQLLLDRDVIVQMLILGSYFRVLIDEKAALPGSRKNLIDLRLV